MKKINLVTLLLAGAGIAYISTVSCENSGGGKKGDSTAAVVGATAHGGTPLSAVLPFDATIPAGDTDMRTTVRRDFDIFSWQSFVALSWPTAAGEIIGQHGDNTTVWGTWKKNYEVFLDNGQKPGPWDIVAQSKQQVLSQESKVPLGNANLTAIFQPEQAGPLIDQNGQYARFEIAMNQEMFEYIDKNTLYNVEGQNKFTDTISFPKGSNKTSTQPPAYGAIMVKASWKILGAGDDTSRFHKIRATIHINALPSRKIKDSSYEAWVGLVGMHIGTRTSICPQWIWSSFEQVDNVPTVGSETDKHYNFYKFSNPLNNKTLNKPPIQPWNAGIQGQKPSQVARVIPIDPGTQALNDSFQKLLIAVNPKSVWQYYELVGTQWPVNGNSKTDRTGNPFPVFLANCTLETYDQGTVQGVSSSCIGCHNAATSFSGRAADFTFLLKTAHSLKK